MTFTVKLLSYRLDLRHRAVPLHEPAGEPSPVALCPTGMKATCLLLAVLAVSGCASGSGGQPEAAGKAATTGASRSCAQQTADAPTLVSLANHLRWDGRTYIGVDDPAADVVYGQQVGTVRCRVADSLTPWPYELQDGDAAVLTEGTPVYRVPGRPVTEALVAELDGRRFLFTATS